MLRRVLALLTIFSVCFAESEKFYNGYKVYDVSLKSEDDFTTLRNLYESDGEKRELDFLSFHKNLKDDVRILVKPDEQEFMEKFFDEKNLKFRVKSENVQDAVDEEHEELSFLSNRKSEKFTFDKYHSYDEISKYLDSLPKLHKNIKVENGGKSFEGREIKHVIVTNGDGRKKNSVFIDAGIHAREWIAPASALYLIDQLTDSSSNLSKLLEKMDFVIQPLVNPDGYEFSRTVAGRFWRKTRSGNAYLCKGVDANRNYDIQWGGVGSSDNFCSETYHGPKVLSEKETQASVNLMKKLKDSCKFFLSFHSYGDYLLYPFGYKYNDGDYMKNNNHHDVAVAGAKAIFKATGKNYTVGATSNTLYRASGSSIDYAYERMGIPVSIVMELTGGGNFGFDLPEKEVDKNVKETAIGIHAMVQAVIEKYPN